MVKPRGFTKAKLRKAQALIGDGKLVLGAKLLEEILAHDPMEGFAWLEYGQVQKELHRYSDSMAAFEKALAAAPENRKAHVLANIGLLRELFVGPESAADYYAQAVQSMVETTPWILILSGANLMLLERHDDAEKLFLDASKIDCDEQGEAYLNLAYLYRSQGAFEEARKAASKALKLDPSEPLAEKVLLSIAVK